LREEPVDARGYVTSEMVWAAMRQFGAEGKAALPTLLEGLKDKNEMVRQCSAWGFQFLGRDADEAIPALVQTFRSETEHRDSRMMAIEALNEMGEGFNSRPADVSGISVAVPDLVGLLQDKDIGIRSTAARTLGGMGDNAKTAVPMLSQLLTYPVSINDAKTWYSNNGESVDDQARLERLIPNLDRNFKISAINALEKIGPDAQSAVPLLNELLNYPEKQVRASSAIALWKITGQTDVASSVLADTIYPPPGPDLYVWRKQMEALAEMGPAAQAALPALQKLAKWGNEEVREPAIQTLNKISPPPANQTAN
jgi:HEAT repeat protein